MSILTDPSLSADPEIYENSDDQSEDLEALTFDDLLSFAYQVAKGMEFLSCKNVWDKGPHCGNSRHNITLYAKGYNRFFFKQRDRLYLMNIHM